MTRRRVVASIALLLAVAATGTGLAIWKRGALLQAEAAAAAAPEPVEVVAAAIAQPRDHRPTVTSVGTVLALRSITLRNELPGTVREVMLTPGAIVEAGDVLVALDVSVEQAELRALTAQAELAESLYRRAERLAASNAISDEELDRARAERDVARAQVERTRAVIARKIVRAPFRARVGLADVHPGQYLNEGTVLTTLQGVDDAVHVDFEVAQQVAARLAVGDTVTVDPPLGGQVSAVIVAIDARVDPATRNAAVRARIDDAVRAPAPGASVKVNVPAGPSERLVSVPANALRKGPAGDHVFVLTTSPEGDARAEQRPVISGPLVGDEVLILSGLAPGERVAASGSFKLRDQALVAVLRETGTEAVASGERAPRVVGF
ncbi:MAG TPA: efflux RND transporter periplasmic adaptor subunit [Gammaproteobacteria bacterium]